ncbi:MAG: fused response regulator/phosphatase [Magnetococcales bacterium]|nr:fused response regulator/phosphatase [Magnetococcales bacterium]
MDKQHKILIIDDDPFDIDVLRTILESEHLLKIATNGMQGLKLVQSGAPPHLILLDIMMPVMNGYEVCQQLKANPETCDIPVIFITAKSSAEDETMGLRLGAIDYITKPFTPSVVQARVRTHISLYAAHQKLEELTERLLEEREIVEEIIANIQHSKPFNPTQVRYLIEPLEKTSGDLILSELRPDGGQHVMLGDFIGHGVTAAIAAPLVADTFHMMTLLNFDMGTICGKINQKLCKTLCGGMFMVSGFVELNPERTQLRLWNCGLHDMFIFRNNFLYKEIPSTLFPRGIQEQSQDTPEIVSVQPRDRIYLYSDGIVEERNANNDIFGTERLQLLLAQMISQNQSLEIIQEALVSFREGGDKKDDISLVELTC